MFQSQKNVFWQALLVTIFVFGTGILLGFMLENWRTSKISTLYAQSEIDLLDIRIQNEIYSLTEIDCEEAINENVVFADRVYSEAKLLEKHEKATKISQGIILQHKKYDLLRTLFWLNSIKIKNKCNATYHNVVYIYKYNNQSWDIKAKQSVYSNLLAQLKQKKGEEIMLIPIAGDNNLHSVSLLMFSYNITESELPVVLIDEKIKITELKTIEEIERLLK